MEFTSFIRDAFEKGYQIDVFYADIKEAFDSVSQPRMIRKLSHFPVSNETLRWLDSYTSERKQFVQIGSSSFDTFEAHSAMGLGTICGPPMFLAYFNDSNEQIQGVGIFNFAHDKKQAAITKKLQQAIDSITKWCKIDGLELNTKKCEIMSFYHKRPFIRATY